MIMRYTGPIRCSFCLVFWLVVSAGCQTQSPLLRDGDPTKPKAMSTSGKGMTSPSDRAGIVSNAAESGIKQTEEMEVISTPFGLIKRSRRRPDSIPLQSSVKPEVQTASQAPSPTSQPESIPEPVQERERDREGAPKDTGEFIAYEPQTEDTSTPDVTADDVALNFDNADLREVIRVVAELLEITCIVDPSVRGNTTIYTSGRLKTTDLFDVFLQILEANGFTAVKSGNVYNIVPLKDASKMPIISRFGRGGAESLQPEERIVMQVIPLEYISASEMSNALGPFISPEGTIVTHDRSNTLIIVDKGKNILKALRLVEAFDIDLFKDFTHRWFSVQYLDADEMVKLLKDVLKAYGKDEKDDFQLIAIERLNRIIAISADDKLLSKLEGFIKEFDQPDEGVEPRIFVYYMKNGKAEDFADILMSVFSEKSDSGRTAAPRDTGGESTPARLSSPFQRQVKEPAEAPVSGIRGGIAQGSGTLRGELRITSDPIRNALIIEAIPSDYRIVEGILAQLDILPRQVLIEVVIAEISVDAKDDIGVAWEYADSDATLDLNLVGGNITSDGLNFTLGRTGRLSATLSALATDDKANILSAPLVLASDNKEAKIDISTQIPVASASIVTTGDNPLTQTTIQYRDTGIILAVTPHINDRGLVSMDISQEVSETGEGQSVGGNTYPSFRQRKVTTSLTVGDGQTIVMGGLMREKEEEIDKGVPFFSSIPVVGVLFGRETKSREKTDLMLFITPRVIVNLSDVDAITQEFKQKVNNLVVLKQRNDNS
jgi:general secretion pathway protein D